MASSKYSQRPRAPSPPGPSPIRQGATPHPHRDNFAFLRQQHSGGGAGHESDTHAYSTVDGPPPPARMSQRPSVPPPAVPPKNRIDRMFGDSHGEESSNEASGNLSAYYDLDKSIQRWGKTGFKKWISTISWAKLYPKSQWSAQNIWTSLGGIWYNEWPYFNPVTKLDYLSMLKPSRSLRNSYQE